jgi:biotin carboxyl carrier protein
VINQFRLILEAAPYDIERKGNMILVNGQEFPWSASGNTYVVGGSTHTVEVRGAVATVDGIAYAIEPQGLEEPRPGRTRQAASPAAADEAGAICAIMPGLIIKINKAEGDQVEAGEVVLVLEAMKMQNELQAKRAGVVRQINVRQGETVEMRQVLAIIA